MQLQTQHKNLLALTLILFIEALSFYILNSVFYRLLVSGHYLLAADVSWSHRLLIYAGMIILAPIMKIVFGLFIGSLSDRFSRKPILLLCFSLAVIGLVFCIVGVFEASLNLLIIGRAVGGIAYVATFIALAAIADFTRGLQRAKYYAMLLFANAVALAVGPHLGIILSDIRVVTWFDISTPFWVSLALILFNFLLLLEFFRDADIKRRKTYSIADTLSYTKLIFSNVMLRRCLFAIMLFNGGWTIFYMNSFLFLREIFHVSNLGLGLFASMIAMSLAVGLIVLFPLLIKKYSAEKLFTFFVSVEAVALLFGLLPFIFIQWCVAVVIGLCAGVIYASYTVFIANAFPEDRIGLGMGMLGVITTAVWLIGGILPALLSHISVYIPAVLDVGLYVVGVFLVYKMINFNALKV